MNRRQFLNLTALTAASYCVSGAAASQTLHRKGTGQNRTARKPNIIYINVAGKWHISEDPRKNGFDLNIAGGPWGSPNRGGYHSPYNYPNCKKDEKGEYLTDRITTEAINAPVPEKTIQRKKK